MSVQSFDERVPVTGIYLFSSGDGTNIKTLITAAGSGSRVDEVLCLSTDTVTRYVDLTIVRGALTMYMGEITVPASAGYLGVAPALATTQAFPASLAGITLMPGDVFGAAMQAAVTAGKAVNVLAFGGHL